MAKLKKSNNVKLTFKEKLLQNSFQPLVHKLLYASYMVYAKDLQSSAISFDEFELKVKDVLSNN